MCLFGGGGGETYQSCRKTLEEMRYRQVPAVTVDEAVVGLDKRTNRNMSAKGLFTPEQITNGISAEHVLS